MPVPSNESTPHLPGRVARRALLVVAAVLSLLATALTPAASAQEAQENEPPTAIVFSPTGTMVNPGDEVTLDGSLSFDPEGGELRYRWTPEPRFSWLPLTGAGREPTVTFYVPNDRYVMEREGVKRFDVTLTVTDERGASSSRSLRLTFNPGPEFEDITVFPALRLEPVEETFDSPSGDMFNYPIVTGVDVVYWTDAHGNFVFDESNSLIRHEDGVIVGLEPHRRLEVRLQNPGLPPVQMYPSLSADQNDDEDFVYVVDEGDTVRVRVQTNEPGVTYEWSQVSGLGMPVPLSGSASSVTFVVPKVTAMDDAGSVEGQTEDVVVMVTAIDADGGSNFLRFGLRVQEVDDSPVVDAGRGQEGAVPLGVTPTQLQALGPGDASAKVRVRLDASDTTDPDPYDVAVAVPDDPATVGVDESRARTVDYEWRVAELETADGLSSEDQDDDNPADNEVRQRLRALLDDFRLEVEDAQGVSLRATLSPLSPGYFVNPMYNDEGTMRDITSSDYLDLLKLDLTSDITALQANCMTAMDADATIDAGDTICRGSNEVNRPAISEEGRRRLYGLVDSGWFDGTPSDVADAVADAGFTMYDSHQLYPRCFAGTTGCLTAEDDDATGFREADPEGEGLTPRVLSYHDAVLESLEAQYRRAVIYRHRGGYSELLDNFLLTPADANDLFAQRIILEDATPFMAIIETSEANSDAKFQIQFSRTGAGIFRSNIALLACVLDLNIARFIGGIGSRQLPADHANCHQTVRGRTVGFFGGDSEKLATLLGGRFLRNTRRSTVMDGMLTGIDNIPLDRLLAVYQETVPGLEGLAETEFSELVSGWSEAQLATLADGLLVPAGTHTQLDMPPQTPQRAIIPQDVLNAGVLEVPLSDVFLWDDTSWMVQAEFFRPGTQVIPNPDYTDADRSFNGRVWFMVRPVDRSLYHRLLPRNPNTRIAVEAAASNINPRAVRQFESPTDNLPDASVSPGPVVFLVMPAACDTNGDGQCVRTGDNADDAADEHPLLGGRVVLEVTARSGDATAARPDRVEVEVSEDPNAQPVAEADIRNNAGRLTSSIQVFEGEPVVLSGLQSDDDNENDPDFEGLTYIWTQVRPTPETADGDSVDLRDMDPRNDVCVNCVFGTDSGGSFTTTEAEVEVVFSGDVTGFQPTAESRRPRQGGFEFTLQVRDQHGVLSDVSERVRVVVVEANEPPTVDAGEDVEVADGDSVTLTAVVADPDLAAEGSSESLTYVWTQTGGEAVAVLEGTDTPSLSFTAEAGAAGATLEFSLTVTDARGLSATDTVAVTVGEGTGDGPGAEPEPDGPAVLGADEQLRVEALATDNADRFAELVAEACADAAGAGSDSDACATGTLGAAPTDPADPDVFFSAGIDGPGFCIEFGATNHGLRLYAFDSDGDGVADTCVLPWSEREANARQAALVALNAELSG